MRKLFGIIAVVFLLLVSPASAQSSSLIASPKENELSSRPGQVVEAVISLQNTSNKFTTVEIDARDFDAATNANNESVVFTDNNPTHGIASWFTDSNIKNRLTIPAKQSVTYRARFQVPYSATDKTHYGAIRFSDINSGSVTNSFVFITVGNPRPLLNITDLTFGDSNEASARYGVFTANIRNSGDSLSRPSASIRVTDSGGAIVMELKNDDKTVLLPEDNQEYVFTPSSPLPEDNLTATLSVIDESGQVSDKSIQLNRQLSLNQSPQANDTSNNDKHAPWLLAALITAAILLVIMLTLLRRHQKLISKKDKKSTSLH